MNVRYSYASRGVYETAQKEDDIRAVQYFREWTSRSGVRFRVFGCRVCDNRFRIVVPRERLALQCRTGVCETLRYPPRVSNTTESFAESTPSSGGLALALWLSSGTLLRRPPMASVI